MYKVKVEEHDNWKKTTITTVNKMTILLHKDGQYMGQIRHKVRTTFEGGHVLWNGPGLYQRLSRWHKCIRYIPEYIDANTDRFALLTFNRLTFEVDGLLSCTACEGYGSSDVVSCWTCYILGG